MPEIHIDGHRMVRVSRDTLWLVEDNVIAWGERIWSVDAPDPAEGWRSLGRDTDGISLWWRPLPAHPG